MYICHQLQQYRQKKDSKGSGSHGKSSKKSGKSDQNEADADAVSSAAKSTALPQAPEGETESPIDANLNIINSSGSHSGEKSAASEINVAAAGPSVVPITHETSVVETPIDQNAESPSQEVGVTKHDVEFSVRNEGENAGTADAEVARVISSDTSHVVDSGGQAKDANMSIPVDVSAQPASVDVAAGMCVTVDTESLSREEESLPSQENINTVLMQQREDQVTDVGCTLLLFLFNFLCIFSILLGFSWKLTGQIRKTDGFDV